MAEHTMTITPEALASLSRSAAPTRQYVLVDGGLVQYGSDTVDVIDIDFTESGGTEAMQEAHYALTLMNQHGFSPTNYERERVVSFLRGLAENDGLELHHPDCDRLLSWYNVNDAYRDEKEAELFDCNLSCNEALADKDTDLEQFSYINVNESAEWIGA